ncbi:MAG: hypothetical protein ABEI74_02940 [Candidatus Pacearchaeota archaeon]
MEDVFNNKILCRKCDSQMKRGQINESGFKIRAMVCPKCGHEIIHPEDKEMYHRFKNLKNKEFKVKMRLVGNSYAVSIPKEIIEFMNEQEKMMDDMVRLCLEDFGKLSLNFNQIKDEIEKSRRKNKGEH